MSRVVVVDYDPNWPMEFEKLREQIWPAVSDFAVSVEHVGSTSVPGLASKPVIDLDVVVPDDAIARGVRRLEGLGYAHRGDLGVPGREAFQRPRGTVAHHLYLCGTRSPALANHVGIRDHLRSDERAAAAYGELKRRLAREHRADMEAYVEGKTDFLLDILAGVGVNPRDLTRIEAANRRSR